MAGERFSWRGATNTGGQGPAAARGKLDTAQPHTSKKYGILKSMEPNDRDSPTVREIKDAVRENREKTDTSETLNLPHMDSACHKRIYDRLTSEIVPSVEEDGATENTALPKLVNEEVASYMIKDGPGLQPTCMMEDS